MKLRLICAVVASLAFAPAASALPLANSGIDRSEFVLVKGGHGHGHAHGHHGRHLGWSIGRHRGWSHSHHRMH